MMDEGRVGLGIDWGKSREKSLHNYKSIEHQGIVGLGLDQGSSTI